MEHQTEHQHRRYRGGVLGPLLWIGAGVLLLLHNLGLLGGHGWASLLRLWPLLLVALGIDLLIGRRSLLGALLSLLLIGMLLGGGVWLALSGRLPEPPAGERITLSYPLTDVTSAEVKLAPAVASVRVMALNDSPNLLEGTAQPFSGERITHQMSLTSGRARVEVRSEGRWGFTGLSPQQVTWDLAFNEGVPLSLEVDGGVGSVELDLARLTLERVELDLGVGETTVYLPAQGAYTLIANGGVGRLDLVLPRNLPVRITASTGVGALNLPAGLSRSNNAYTSANYAAAEEAVDISLNVGVGEVNVRYSGD